jgi:hypothetical protein
MAARIDKYLLNQSIRIISWFRRFAQYVVCESDGFFICKSSPDALNSSGYDIAEKCLDTANQYEIDAIYSRNDN